LRNLKPAPPVPPLGGAELALDDQEGGLGRIALDLPGAGVGLAQIGIAGQAAAAQHDDVLVAQRPGPTYHDDRDHDHRGAEHAADAHHLLLQRRAFLGRGVPSMPAMPVTSVTMPVAVTRAPA
jgi:hypothetical protein